MIFDYEYTSKSVEERISTGIYTRWKSRERLPEYNEY